MNLPAMWTPEDRSNPMLGKPTGRILTRLSSPSRALAVSLDPRELDEILRVQPTAVLPMSRPTGRI